jgi:hypothetical protein
MSRKRNPMQQVSNLGRDIDPNYRTNLIIMILTPLSAVVAFVIAVIAGMGFGDAAVRAFFTAGATFAAWAFSREIDPDHDWSAFVAVGLAWIGCYIYRAPVFGAFSLAMMMYALRMTNRVVGAAPTVVDSGLILAEIAVTAFLNNWVVAWVGVAAFLLDGLMVNKVKRHLALAGIAALITLLRPLVIPLPDMYTLSNENLIAVVVVSLAFFLTIAATRKLTSKTDTGNKSLNVPRVRAAMILTLAASIVSVLWNGDFGVQWMYPLWTAMFGVALYCLPVTVREWSKYQQKRAKAAR